VCSISSVTLLSCRCIINNTIIIPVISPSRELIKSGYRVTIIHNMIPLFIIRPNTQPNFLCGPANGSPCVCV
jgi:hypothetical protein